MVRMADLVRARTVTAPVEELAPEEVAPEPTALPAVTPRLSLRSMDKAPDTAPRPRPHPAVLARAAAAVPAVPPALEASPGPPTSVFEDLQATLALVREHVKSERAPAWPDLERVVQRVVLSLEEGGELFWLANAPSLPAGADYLVVHQSRVAVLAARIGLNAGYDRAHAVALGMAGALIDIGLWQLPETVLRRPDALTADEQALYRAHPQRSAALLARWGAPERLVDAVLQHHEREQGQGFPQRLAGAAIRHEAKILGLVDAYTSLTLPGSRRPGQRPHEAIREIVRSKHESFSPALIKALLTEISVFPPGTLVRLNTGEVGQVTAVNRNHPLRPRVQVVADSKGHRPVIPKAVDLSETPFLYITGPQPEPTK
jgi:HD-GYP domain-containing protein (c-di-GMP phosphodiesterase class II)